MIVFVILSIKCFSFLKNVYRFPLCTDFAVFISYKNSRGIIHLFIHAYNLYTIYRMKQLTGKNEIDFLSSRLISFIPFPCPGVGNGRIYFCHPSVSICKITIFSYTNIPKIRNEHTHTHTRTHTHPLTHTHTHTHTHAHTHTHTHTHTHSHTHTNTHTHTHTHTHNHTHTHTHTIIYTLIANSSLVNKHKINICLV